MRTRYRRLEIRQHRIDSAELGKLDRLATGVDHDGGMAAGRF
jgi:hypothetical protein